MSRKWKTLVFSGAFVLAVCVASTILISSATMHSAAVATRAAPQTQVTPPTRNLRLQPEAASVNRRLGNRFKLSSQAEYVFSGTLTFSGKQQPVTMIRRQTDRGEHVEVQLASRQLVWTNAEGIKAMAGSVSEPERVLMERLIFDSPDEFVLAQLRGASYYTITRNLRPNDAGENYRGPLWRLVRISEPQGRWRLYYINEVTELIDRVVSELDGQQIEAIIQWTNSNGEQIPLNIKWMRSGEKLMEFQVTTFLQNK
jgi:hypothetical protein